MKGPRSAPLGSSRVVAGLQQHMQLMCDLFWNLDDAATSPVYVSDHRIVEKFGGLAGAITNVSKHNQHFMSRFARATAWVDTGPTQAAVMPTQNVQEPVLHQDGMLHCICRVMLHMLSPCKQ